MIDLALCIGVDRSRLAPALSHAARDALALVAMLSSRNTKARLFTNEQATLGEVRAALTLLAGEVTREARVVVSFSGHGTLPRGLRGGMGAMVVSDGLLGGEELLDRLSSLECAEVTVIIDACHALGLMPRPVHVFRADGAEETLGDGAGAGPSRLRYLAGAALGPWAMERASGDTLLSRLVHAAAPHPGISLRALGERLARELSARERVFVSCGERALDGPAF